MCSLVITVSTSQVLLTHRHVFTSHYSVNKPSAINTSSCVLNDSHLLSRKHRNTVSSRELMKSSTQKHCFFKGTDEVCSCQVSSVDNCHTCTVLIIPALQHSLLAATCLWPPSVPRPGLSCSSLDIVQFNLGSLKKWAVKKWPPQFLRPPCG